MYRFFLLLGTICLLAPVAPGALIFQNTRTAWEDAVNLTGAFSEGGANPRWIDFSPATYCPTNNCPDSGQTRQYSSATGLGAMMTMGGSLTGLTFEGFSSAVGSNVVRLWLQDKDVFPLNWRIDGTKVNVVQTASSAAARMRINLPAGVRAFAMEVGLGCRNSAGCTSGENVPGLITLQTNNPGETRTLGDTSTQEFVNTPTVGDFTFFGFTTDQPSIAWIDLTPSSPAAVVMARFTYATELTSSSGGGGPVPEPAPGWLFAAGLVLLATHRLKRRS